ncbi:C-terminal helicase domain-containing protein, partial [Acidiphilium angustum]|uniref:C-terminal helicase domain-containing protein n=1 Tax=Acidiphilium angustum TaxID=523 RepID=UPI001FE08F4E
DAVDIEPGTAFAIDPELNALMARAENLVHEADPKMAALVDTLLPLIKKGANPVVFCRYLATAEHVRDGLRRAFPKLTIESVTGVLTPDERRDRVAEMAPADDDKQLSRILVATDCLSEGINLQQLFDTVVHYDLSWNPTRHQQREGRVDRFGQPAELVRSIMMFSPDSAIDGAVLDVILRKANKIRKTTGVTVPLPDERGPVTDALMASMMLRRGTHRQLSLDLRLDDGTRALETSWRDAEENEKKSRARFAQNAMKPQEIAPEWQKVRSLLGSPADARQFVERAMARFGVPLEVRKTILLAHVNALEAGLRERLAEHAINGSVRLATAEPAPSGTALLTRTHPLTATLAEALFEASLDPEALAGLGIGRVGAWDPCRLASHPVQADNPCPQGAFAAGGGSRHHRDPGRPDRRVRRSCPGVADRTRHSRSGARCARQVHCCREGAIAQPPRRTDHRLRSLARRTTYGGSRQASRRIRYGIARHGGRRASTGRHRPVCPAAG